MKRFLAGFAIACGLILVMGAVNPGSEPTIINTTLTNADTEYTINMPATYNKFSVQVRSGGDLKCAFTSGDSGTTYWSIPSGGIWYEDAIFLSNDIYCQSPTAGTVVETVAYK